jgi:hypothetical protein
VADPDRRFALERELEIDVEALSNSALCVHQLPLLHDTFLARLFDSSSVDGVVTHCS